MNDQELNKVLELAKRKLGEDVIQRDKTIDSLACALLQVHGELEQAKQENEDLNGYAEAAQMFAKERDQLRTELLEAQGYIEELDKKLTQANATAEKYREALKEVIGSWDRDEDYSCDEPMVDCEVADPRDDNQGIRCDWHDFMNRTRQALSSPAPSRIEFHEMTAEESKQHFKAIQSFFKNDSLAPSGRVQSLEEFWQADQELHEHHTHCKICLMKLDCETYNPIKDRWMLAREKLSEVQE